MSELQIQRADPRDAEAILTYLKRVGGESDNLLFGAEGLPISVEQERRFLEAMSKAERDVMLVGKMDGEIVSVASVQSFGRPRVFHRGSVAISVRKDRWGMGVGTKMLRALIDFARAVDMVVLELEVRTDNDRAIALYKKLGFRTIGVYEKFFSIDGAYFDAYLMNLYF